MSAQINWITPLTLAAGIILVWLVLDPPQGDMPGASDPPSPVISSSEPSTTTQPSIEPSVVTKSHPEEGAYQERDDKDKPTATPPREGQDNPVYTHTPADQAAAVDVSKRFIAAWLLTDPAARRVQLIPLAASALVDELSEPRLRIWQTLPKGDPTITTQATGAATTEQEFGDGRRVAMLLLYDPTIETHWTVIDIQPKES